MSIFAERLSQARNIRGYSQQKLAYAIGVSQSVIVNLEDRTGKRLTKAPQEIVINAICRELCISKSWLVSGIGEMDNGYSEKEVLNRLIHETSDFSNAEWSFLFKIIENLKELNREKEMEKEPTRGGVDDLINGAKNSKENKTTWKNMDSEKRER